MSNKEEKVLQSGVLRRRAKAHTEAPDTQGAALPVPESLRNVLSAEALALVSAVDTSCQTVSFDLSSCYSLPGLPEGYYFKGGAAREQLREVLSGNVKKVQVRDYDLLRYMDTNDSLDHELSERFMSDDYEFGRGVEVVENKAVYFQTRDISQNEALARNGVLEASWAAVTDIQGGVLRPTSYVTDRRGDVLSATVAKLYRFAAEFQIKGQKYILTDVPEDAYVSYFSAALNLDRSFDLGEAVASEYVLLLWERSDVFSDFEVPPPLSVAVEKLAREIHQGLSLFRNLPMSVLRDLT